MSNEKPPLGVKPSWMCAWQRIGDLCEAIVRQYESHDGNAHLCKQWAREIVMQCEIIEEMRKEELHVNQRRKNPFPW